MSSLTTECYCIFWLSCSPENASTEAKQTLEILHMVLAVTQGPMDQQALMNLNTSLWTLFIPFPPLERIHSHHTDVAHTYEGIQETKSPFTYKNNAGPHGLHPSVTCDLELGDPIMERAYTILKSLGHEYATLEQGSQTQGWDHICVYVITTCFLGCITVCHHFVAILHHTFGCYW